MERLFHFQKLIANLSPGRRDITPIPVDKHEIGKEYNETVAQYRLKLKDNPEQFFLETLFTRDVKRIRLDWRGCGKTAGVAVWGYIDNTAAITLYLTGLEEKKDVSDMHEALRYFGFALPRSIMEMVENDPCRPLATIIYYHHKALLDPEMNTLIAAMGMAFYSQFGLCLKEQD